MVREFLRMSHISTGERLKDINLTIFEGEILFLLSNHRGELEEIWQVIAGCRKMISGAFFLEEKPVNEYNEEFCASHGIFHIDPGAQLAEKMSVAENIFVIREKKWNHVFSSYNRKAVVIETKEVLKQVELSCEPEMKVWQLEPFERFQVCLAKAIVSGAKLLLIDDVENEYNSSEKRKMRKLLLSLREKGVASLILADRPGEVLEGVRKIVLVKNGRDIKSYFSQDKRYFSQETLYQTITKAWLDISASRSNVSAYGGEARGNSGICIAGHHLQMNLEYGKIYGFYDGFWDKEKNLREYLADFEEKNSVAYYFGESGERYSMEQLLEDGKAVYIPRNSAFLLLENMTIGENIAVPNRKRTANRIGMSVRRIDSFMEDEFCREIGVMPGTPVWKLNCMQKKILSIYRWLIEKPAIVILEDPTYRLNLQEADGLREYLKKLAGCGQTLFVSESSFYEEELFCDMIIHSEKNLYLASIDKEEYSKVEVEWLF